MKANNITIKTAQQLESFIKDLRDDFNEHKHIAITIESGVRTLTQNSSLHLYCEMVASALNDAGYDVNTFFKKGFTVPFSKHIVKDNMWKPIQKAISNQDSTTKPTTKEYIEIFEYMNNLLADKGIHVEWPSDDSLRNKQRK